MALFEVSVPGKFSLFGEHAVKYGRAGLMGGIDLYTTLAFEEISDSNIILYVAYPRIQMLKVPLELILRIYNNCLQDIESLNREVLQSITDVNKSFSDTMIIRAFYYLLIYIAYKEQIEIKGFRMHLSSEFLVDNQFLCSTSITVCFVVCLLKWSYLQKGVDTNSFDNANVEKIQSYATHYESIFSQSGIVDVRTCLYGTLAQYQDKHITRILNRVPNITILLVDSKQEQCLDAQVQQVVELMNTAPGIIYSIFNSINDITNTAFYAFLKLFDIYDNIYLDSASKFSRAIAELKILEKCTHENQDLLNSFNMAHHLDIICSIARKHGMCGKYTDINDGRFAYIWCPRHCNEPCTHMKPVADELTEQGFHVMETKFAHEGVNIQMYEKTKLI